MDPSVAHSMVCVLKRLNTPLSLSAAPRTTLKNDTCPPAPPTTMGKTLQVLCRHQSILEEETEEEHTYRPSVQAPLGE